MGSYAPPADRPMIEPDNIDERFVSGLAGYERVGDVTFLVFYVDQIIASTCAIPRERRIAARFVMPNDAIERMVRMLRPGPNLASAVAAIAPILV